MSGFKNILLDSESASLDLNRRLRISQANVLADLKLVGYEDRTKFESTGTGSGIFSNNTVLMTVAAGQYLIRSSKLFFQYQSGTSQLIECGFERFGTTANLVKRIGYFSSNAVAPYDTNYDGFWLENDGTTIRLMAANNGISTVNSPLAAWDNSTEFATYDWNRFGSIIFDYSSHGGNALRLFIMLNGEYVLAHTVKWAGNNSGLMMRSPNQKVRYEIRSTGAAGSMTYISAQISSDGQNHAPKKELSVNTGLTSITFSTVGTTYPVKAISLQSAFRDTFLQISSLQTYINSNNDVARYSVQLNPTLSAALAYSNIPSTGAREAKGDGVITVIANGIFLDQGFIMMGISPIIKLEDNILSKLGSTLNNTMDSIVLCMTPITASVGMQAIMNFKEF